MAYGRMVTVWPPASVVVTIAIPRQVSASTGADVWSANRDALPDWFVVAVAPPPSSSLPAGQSTVPVTVVPAAAPDAEVTALPVMSCGTG
jgi:hypothetical protein